MTEHPKKKRKVAVASDQPCWTENDRSVLVRLVKQCQKLGSEGSSGSWKNFLKVIWFFNCVNVPESNTVLLVCKVLVHIQVKYPKFRSQDPSQHHWKVRSPEVIFPAKVTLIDFPPN